MGHNTETPIQNRMIVALAQKGCIAFRRQVGKFYTTSGQIIKIGVPGESDIQGHTPEGYAFYIETKTEVGRLRPEQKKFGEAMLKTGAIWGVARSDEDAIKIIEEGVKRINERHKSNN